MDLSKNVCSPDRSNVLDGIGAAIEVSPRKPLTKSVMDLHNWAAIMIIGGACDYSAIKNIS